MTLTVPAPADRRSPRAPSRHRGLVLAVVLLAALAINVDTTIVNVALPALNRQLGSSTTDLQWVVDGYNLAFAALVLVGETSATGTAGAAPWPSGWCFSR